MHSEVSFDNTSKAFATKSDSQLNESLWLFRFMKNSTFVKVFSQITLVALKIGLPVKTIIKKTIFKQFCGGENIAEAKNEVNKLKRSNIGSILDYSVEGKESDEDFEKTKREILKIIALAENNAAIPYTSLKISGIISSSILEKLSAGKKLNSAELKEYEKGKSRLEEICQAAYNSQVPVYFDAEESWIQEEIDRVAEEMMREYNKDRAIILTTLQMYRTDRKKYLKFLLRTAQEEKFFIGIKLVRGAYLEKENARAAELRYQSPIQISKENTDKDFDEAITICLENIQLITLCAGTHNEASTLHLLDEMQRLGIENNDPNVFFSQLYGMSDHITYNLAEANYNVTKYLPYGPVKSVIPYLIRRAQENTAIAGQIGRELKLITEEKLRRLKQPLLTTV
jgi:proline dehydrogenase